VTIIRKKWCHWWKKEKDDTKRNWT